MLTAHTHTYICASPLITYGNNKIIIIRCRRRRNRCCHTNIAIDKQCCAAVCALFKLFPKLNVNRIIIANTFDYCLMDWKLFMTDAAVVVHFTSSDRESCRFVVCPLVDGIRRGKSIDLCRSTVCIHIHIYLWSGRHREPLIAVIAMRRQKQRSIYDVDIWNKGDEINSEFQLLHFFTRWKLLLFFQNFIELFPQGKPFPAAR